MNKESKKMLNHIMLAFGHLPRKRKKEQRKFLARAFERAERLEKNLKFE